MSFQSAQLTVEFQSTEFASELILEYHVGPHQQGRGIPLRLYPAVPAILRATRGTLESGETRVEDVDEIVKFTGSATARLKRPAAYQIAFYDLSVAYSLTGEVILPVLHYDADQDEIVADQPFYGGIRVTYRSNYNVLYYNPTVTYTYYADGSIGSYTQYGTAYAFYQNKAAIMDVDVTIQNKERYQEYYRIVSTIVLDADGAHEMPPNWPTDGAYPYFSSDYDLDPDNSLTEDRIHEVGFVDNIGIINNLLNRYYVSILPPYAQSGLTYHPVYHIKYAQPNVNGLDSNETQMWQQAFASVNRTELFDDLSDKYDGLTVA